MARACYRELRRYKYQLLADYEDTIPLRPPADQAFRFVALSAAGRLLVRSGYAWDGPSGPTLDTRDFMRGSLVHDALYQLMRLGALDWRTQREAADDLLRDLCIADGMPRWRAWYVHRGVRLFAEGNARPRREPETEIICVP